MVDIRANLGTNYRPLSVFLTHLSLLAPFCSCTLFIFLSFSCSLCLYTCEWIQRQVENHTTSNDRHLRPFCTAVRALTCDRRALGRRVSQSRAFLAFPTTLVCTRSTFWKCSVSQRGRSSTAGGCWQSFHLSSTGRWVEFLQAPKCPRELCSFLGGFYFSTLLSCSVLSQHVWKKVGWLFHTKNFTNASLCIGEPLRYCLDSSLYMKVQLQLCDIQTFYNL